MRTALGLACAALVAGCAAAGPDGVMTRGGHPRPHRVGLLYPQVEAGAVLAGAWPGGRRMMGGEAIAVVHVAAREALAPRGRLWRDLSEEEATRSRTALLTTAMHREYSLTGAVPARLANEMARVAATDAAVLVSITTFGPSERRMGLRKIGASPKADGPAGTWINCGVTVVLVKTPGGDLLWEGADLESLDVAAGGTAEQAAREAIRKVLAALP